MRSEVWAAADSNSGGRKRENSARLSASRNAGSARQLRTVVVVCRYRPVFPLGLADDVQTAYHYARTLGEVVVVGNRLGATLGAGLLVQLRDRGAALPRCAARWSRP